MRHPMREQYKLHMRISHNSKIYYGNKQLPYELASMES